MTLLAAEDLVCIRGERCLFEGLSFALGAGEALLVTGANGSGKSSLLRLVAGLLRPAAGSILWAGEPVARDPDAHHGRLAYIGHHDAVKPVLSLAENLAFWSRFAGRGDEAVAPALAHFGLSALADLPARMLSAGQRRRLALARLATSAAALWLLDEPTVGLDAAAIAMLEEAIAAQRAAGGLVILATHVALALPGAAGLALARYAPGREPAGLATP